MSLVFKHAKHLIKTSKKVSFFGLFIYLFLTKNFFGQILTIVFYQR